MGLPSGVEGAAGAEAGAGDEGAGDEREASLRAIDNRCSALRGISTSSLKVSFRADFADRLRRC